MKQQDGRYGLCYNRNVVGAMPRTDAFCSTERPMRRTLARLFILGAPIALVLGFAGQAGGPERTIIRTATIHGTSGPVYYSSLEGRYLPVGPSNEEEVAGLAPPEAAK